MTSQNFLNLVKKHGGYRSDGEASRAANAVFSTMKGWITPAASDRVRKVLPQDASRLWQYSPADGSAGHQPTFGHKSTALLHFILKIQQIGRYHSSGEARRAACSVMGAMLRSVSNERTRFVGQVLPPEIGEFCPADIELRAA